MRERAIEGGLDSLQNCEMCNGENSTIYQNDNKEWILSFEEYDFEHDCYDYIKRVINYCPWCGRKLSK